VSSTNPAPEQGEITADNAAESATDIAVRTGAPPELMANSIGEYGRIWLKQIRSGESGALPVIIGLIVIVIFFQIKSSQFLSAGNLVNLMTQAAFIITLGMAEVFVLLLGEIDLAAGFTAACGAVIALYLVAKNYPWWVAVLACLAATGAYGAVQGLIITWLRLPSFVVSLAGYLFLSGALLFLIDSTGAIGNGGVIRLNNNVLNDIEAGALTAAASWIVMIALVALAGVMMYLRDHRRRSNGLVAPPLSITLLKIGAIAVAGVVVVLVGNSNRGTLFLAVRGLPWVVLGAPGSAATSTRSAATPRRPAGRASTPTGSR
jgi:D-xylose transport system permease protein